MGSAMQRAREIDPTKVSAEAALGYKKPVHRAAEGLTLGQRMREGIRKTFGGSGKPAAEKPAIPAPEEKKKKKPGFGAGSKHSEKYKEVME